MRRIRSDCCARAASGHVAAPPSSVMNVRLGIPVIVARSVMAGLGPAIHVFAFLNKRDVDVGHDV
jgi:hypothetical protein